MAVAILKTVHKKALVALRIKPVRGLSNSGVVDETT